MENLYWSKRQI